MNAKELSGIMKGRTARLALMWLAVGTSLCLIACGGGSSSPPPAPITVVVAPATTTMQAGAGAMQQFTATVQNTGNTSVTWTLTQGGTACLPACGTLSSTNSNPVMYIAPATVANNPMVTVTATSLADPTKSASATVMITAPAIAVSVSPATASAIVNTTQQFTATVTNDPANQGVTWSLTQGGNACSPACGTLNSATANPVTYTAPSAITASPTVTITATSAADASKAASAAVTVTLPVLTIFPGSEVLGPNGARFLTAQIVGLSDQSVTWSVQEGTTGGTVTSTGLYTAPAATGTYHVVATSVANSSVTAIAQITVIGAGFKPIPSMNEARALPTATALKDGRVLVTGGFPDNSSAPVASAELYDPAKGSFSSIASMAKPRGGHTATLLQDGTVLVAGGGVDANDFSAELFDPVAGTFTLVPVPMNAQRNFHTATLLPNGQVLLVGGTDNSFSSVVDTAEVYDPTAKTFTAVMGTMTSRRWSHTATSLNNEKILITGGFQDTNFSATSSADLFDPVSGTFKPTGITDRPRGRHSATLLANGRVLIAGGLNRFVGGFADTTDELYSSAELYDPAIGTFQPAGYMADARLLHTAIRLPDGMVLLSGGSSLLELLATAELYDPQTGSFTATGSLEMRLTGQAAVLLNDGQVLVVGGLARSGTSVSIAEVYQ